MHIKHFIHQGQNDKYLVNPCPVQHFSDEKQLIRWLDMFVKNENKKMQSNNKSITSNFHLKSFSELSDQLF